MLAEVADKLVPVGPVAAIMLPIAAVFLVAGLRLRGFMALAPLPLVLIDLLPLGMSEGDDFMRAVEAEGVLMTYVLGFRVLPALPAFAWIIGISIRLGQAGWLHVERERGRS